MKRSKTAHFIRIVVFAKMKKWEGTDAVVVSGTYVKCCY